MGLVKLTGFTLTLLRAAKKIDPRKMRAQTTEIFLTEKWGTLEAVKKKITKNQTLFIHTHFQRENAKS